MAALLDRVVRDHVTVVTEDHAAAVRQARAHVDDMLPIEERGVANTMLGAAVLPKPGTQVLSLEPLTWRRSYSVNTLRHGRVWGRRRRSLPKLMFFDPWSTNGTTTLEYTEGRYGGGGNRVGVHTQILGPLLPDVVRQRYEDIDARLRHHYRRTFGGASSARYTATFPTGVIPQEIRDLVRTAGEQYGRQNVWFLAEVAAWKAQESPRRLLDPLVVAWDGDNLLLLGKFDLTPVETYVAAEFASKG